MEEEKEPKEVPAANPQEEETKKVAEELSELAEIRQRYEQEIEELKLDLQRERADFINYRKRVQQEKANLSVEIAARLLMKLLPVFDAFGQLFSMRQAENTMENLDKFFEGVAIIQKQLWEVFSSEGLEEIDPTNQEFDSNFMEAIDYQEGDVPTEMVGAVYQKGYRIPSRVLRPARVQVIRPRKVQQNEESTNNNSENLEDKGGE